MRALSAKQAKGIDQAMATYIEHSGDIFTELDGVLKTCEGSVTAEGGRASRGTGVQRARYPFKRRAIKKLVAKARDCARLRVEASLFIVQ